MILYGNFSMRNSAKIPRALEGEHKLGKAPTSPWWHTHTQRALRYHSAQAAEVAVKSDSITVHIPEPLCHEQVVFFPR